MKKFILAVMLVVGFVSFSGNSEAGPVRNFVRSVREARQCQSSQVTVAAPVTSSCSGCSGSVSSAPVNYSAANTAFATPVRSTLSNVWNAIAPTCTNCRR